MSTRAIALVLSVAAMSACTSTAEQRYGRYIQPAPNIGKVVATELAFARAAQEDGQWTAFSEYAADGALIFGRTGAIEAKPWLATLENPPEAVAWEPHRVWSSCDGSLAVTQGAFRGPDGQVGTFNTVWQRQRNGEYRWVFDFGHEQDQSPVKPEMIASHLADCDARLPAPTEDAGAAMQFSRDGSVAWSYQFIGEGERHYKVWIASREGWQQVVDLKLPADQSE